MINSETRKSLEFYNIRSSSKLKVVPSQKCIFTTVEGKWIIGTFEGSRGLLNIKC